MNVKVQYCNGYDNLMFQGYRNEFLTDQSILVRGSLFTAAER